MYKVKIITPKFTKESMVPDDSTAIGAAKALIQIFYKYPGRNTTPTFEYTLGLLDGIWLYWDRKSKVTINDPNISVTIEIELVEE